MAPNALPIQLQGCFACVLANSALVLETLSSLIAGSIF